MRPIAIWSLAAKDRRHLIVGGQPPAKAVSAGRAPIADQRDWGRQAGSRQRLTPALSALPRLIPRAGTAEVRNAAMTKVDQMLGRKDGSGALVDTHRQHGAVGPAVEDDDGDPIARAGAEIKSRAVMADHDHRLRTSGHDALQSRADGVRGNVRQRRQDGAESRSPSSGLDANDRARRPKVAQIGHDDPDDRGPAGHQGASRGVAPVAQLDDRLEYSLLGFGPNEGRVVEDP